MRGYLAGVSEPTATRTWNTQRFETKGEYPAIASGFGGRNHQYVSEDGSRSYIITAHETAATQANPILTAVQDFIREQHEWLG